MSITYGAGCMPADVLGIFVWLALDPSCDVDATVLASCGGRPDDGSVVVPITIFHLPSRRGAAGTTRRSQSPRRASRAARWTAAPERAPAGPHTCPRC